MINLGYQGFIALQNSCCNVATKYWSGKSPSSKDINGCKKARTINTPKSAYSLSFYFAAGVIHNSFVYRTFSTQEPIQ